MAPRGGGVQDLIEMSERTVASAGHIGTKRPPAPPLIPSLPLDGAKDDQRWQLLVNAEVEAEL